jgi:hypothetical protein
MLRPCVELIKNFWHDSDFIANDSKASIKVSIKVKVKKVKR